MKRTYLLIAFCFFLRLSYSADNHISRVTQPTPTSASLGIFGNTPVGNYTGIPGITIPIYTIKSGDITLPIELKYHASGIRVAQEASWVGLGWTLNAGGAITRTVCGGDDFSSSSPQGYYYASGFTPLTSTLLTQTAVSAGQNCPGYYGNQTYNFYNQIEGNLTVDSEPDIFEFNFNGMSGRFYFKKKTGNLSYAVPINEEQNNLNIKYFPTEQRWEVIDDKGFKYYFQSNEIAKNYSTVRTNASYINYSTFTHNGNENDLIGNWYLNNGGNSGYITTAWYLDRIESPTGNTITFEYDKRDYRTQTPVFRDEEIFLLKNTTGFSITPNLKWRYEKYGYSRTISREIYLNKINFDGNSIMFNTSDRDDIEQITSQLNPTLKPQKLDNIEIKNHSNESLSKYSFDYSYFGNPNVMPPSLSLRLKLNSVTPQTYSAELKEMISNPPYTFEYNMEGLPLKTSNSIDHWGYFNNKECAVLWGYAHNEVPYVGQERGTKLPATNLPGSVADLVEGSDRTSDETAMQHGILTSIIYPTGGRTNFEYEANTCFMRDIDWYKPDFSVGIACAGDDSEYDDEHLDEDFVDFNLLFNQSIRLTVGFYDCATTFYTDGFNTRNNGALFATLYKIVNGTPTKIKEFRDYGADNLTPQEVARIVNEADFYDNNFFYSKNQQLALEAGQYRIVANKLPLPVNNQETMSFAIVEYQERNIYDLQPINQIVGGLRIKEITDVSGNENTVKRYSYENEDSNNSSGILMTVPSYFYTDLIADNNGHIAYYNVGTSNGYYPMSYAAAGSHIGYSRVAEATIRNGEQFKKVYYYHNTADELPSINVVNQKLGMNITDQNLIIPGVPSVKNFTNGLLYRELSYNSSNDIVERKEYNYSKFDNFDNAIVGLKVRKNGNTNALTDDMSAELQPEWMAMAGYCTGPTLLLLKFYYHKCETHKLESITTTEYHTQGGGNVVKTTNYEYNPSNLLINKEKNSLSDGRIQTTEMYYPSDFVNANLSTSHPLWGMVLRNMINYPVVEKTLTGTNLTNSTLTTYKFYDGVNAVSNILPNAVYGLLKSMPIQNITSFSTANTDPFYVIDSHLKEQVNLGYYKNGRIKEVNNYNNVPTTYLWSYNSQYPIAEIKNATYNEVKLALEYTDLQIEDLSNNYIPDVNMIRGKLDTYFKQKSALITTYTYKPLVGVISKTDPRGVTTYYEYDSFNRLQNIKDTGGSILKNFNYHYKP